MSLIESLPKVGNKVRQLTVPKADGLLPWLVPLAIILIWQAASVAGLVSPRVLPAPSDVARAVGYGSLDAMGRAFRDAQLPAPSVVQEAVRYPDA